MDAVLIANEGVMQMRLLEHAPFMPHVHTQILALLDIKHVSIQVSALQNGRPANTKILEPFGKNAEAINTNRKSIKQVPVLSAGRRRNLRKCPHLYQAYKID